MYLTASRMVTLNSSARRKHCFGMLQVIFGRVSNCDFQLESISVFLKERAFVESPTSGESNPSVQIAKLQNAENGKWLPRHGS